MQCGILTDPPLSAEGKTVPDLAIATTESGVVSDTLLRNYFSLVPVVFTWRHEHNTAVFLV